MECSMSENGTQEFENDSPGWPSTSQTDWKTTQKEELTFEDC